MKTYELLVKTNCYAGNFEREMCAFMTGQLGEEDNTGKEFVEYEIGKRFEDKISSAIDDHGNFRPVSLDENDSNNFIIHLEEPLSDKDMKFLGERAELFEKTRPYEYLDKTFEFLGLELYEVEEVKNKVKI